MAILSKLVSLPRRTGLPGPEQYTFTLRDKGRMPSEKREMDIRIFPFPRKEEREENL